MTPTFPIPTTSVAGISCTKYIKIPGTIALVCVRRGGALWLTSNVHLPYEGVLKPLFGRVELRAEARGFKVFEARK